MKSNKKRKINQKEKSILDKNSAAPVLSHIKNCKTLKKRKLEIKKSLQSPYNIVWLVTVTYLPLFNLIWHCLDSLSDYSVIFITLSLFQAHRLTHLKYPLLIYFLIYYYL